MNKISTAQTDMILTVFSKQQYYCENQKIMRKVSNIVIVIAKSCTRWRCPFFGFFGLDVFDVFDLDRRFASSHELHGLDVVQVHHLHQPDKRITLNTIIYKAKAFFAMFRDPRRVIESQNYDIVLESGTHNWNVNKLNSKGMGFKYHPIQNMTILRLDLNDSYSLLYH